MGLHNLRGTLIYGFSVLGGAAVAAVLLDAWVFSVVLIFTSLAGSGVFSVWIFSRKKSCYDAAASSEAERERRVTQFLLYYRGEITCYTMSARKELPQHQINYPVSQSYIYQTPLVHDSPATRTQSSSENLVSQTAPLLGTRCYLRNSSGIAR